MAIDETKPATASRPKNGGAAAGGGSYSGFAKKNTGKATMYSGVQSADNPFQNTTQHYGDAPARKSIAANRVRQNGGRTEVPG